MSIYEDIARRMTPEALESLERFRSATERGEGLPAALGELPMGFLRCVGWSDDLEPLHVLSPMGERVAAAARKMSDEEAA